MVSLCNNELTELNSLVPGMCTCKLKYLICKYILMSDIRIHVYFLWICIVADASEPHWWLVSIGLVMALCHQATKPLPEPMLADFFEAILYHETSLSRLHPVLWHVFSHSVRPGDISFNWVTIGSGNDMSSCFVPSHYLHHCWLIIDRPIRDKLQ